MYAILAHNPTKQTSKDKCQKMQFNTREIVVYKLAAQHSNPNLGYLRAVAEKIENSYIPLNSENFCSSGKVFVTHGYEDIDGRYSDFQIFKVTVKESESRSEDLKSEKSCNYITTFLEAVDLKPRELVEIIPCDLPDPNNMIVSSNNVPSTTYVYIIDDTTCYGPFKWEDATEGMLTLKKPDSPLPGRGKGLISGNIYSGTIDNLKQYVMYCQPMEGERFYFESMTELQNDSNLSKIEYFSDEDIINHFIKLSKEIGFSGKKIDLDYLSANIKKHPKHNHKASLDKLKMLKDIGFDQNRFRNDVIEEFNKFFRSDLGDEITKKYIGNNRDMYLSEIRDEYRAKLEHEFLERNKEKSKLEEKIEAKKQELIDLGRDIEERSGINTGILYNAKESEELDKKIKEKLDRLEKLNEKTDSLLIKYNKYNTLDEIEEEIKILETERTISSRQAFKIEEEIKTLEDKLKENEDLLRKKLFDLKPFVETINGSAVITNKGELKNTSQKILYVETPSGNAQNIIKHVEQKLREKGRNFSTLDVINLTVTLQQSFISFFAGLPGGGKTTLAKLIAEIYGIQENRFLNVPVARGWTGQRDLIGFFNPISNNFQSSSTGMYEFLTALSEETEDRDSDNALSMILLDEANLSPMEHYWSSFMGLTDSKDIRELKLGNKYINITDNLRFISTVNYDSTTEYLSPRLIDRAPIIVLEPNTIITTSNQLISEDVNSTINVPISYKVMEKYFGVTDYIPEFVGPELEIYDEVKSILSERNNDLGKPISISNRKEMAIRQYCNKARPLMREVSTDDDLLAIDYALLQLVLPLVRGHGKSFGKRLERLKDVLINSELERSSTYLDTIINNGNAELYTYDFFCW